MPPEPYQNDSSNSTSGTDSDKISEECAQRQEDELEVLESIWPGAFDRLTPSTRFQPGTTDNLSDGSTVDSSTGLATRRGRIIDLKLPIRLAEPRRFLLVHPKSCASSNINPIQSSNAGGIVDADKRESPRVHLQSRSLKPPQSGSLDNDLELKAAPKAEGEFRISLTSLPDLNVKLHLPVDYPLVTGPSILSLKADDHWLPLHDNIDESIATSKADGTERPQSEAQIDNFRVPKSGTTLDHANQHSPSRRAARIQQRSPSKTLRSLGGRLRALYNETQGEVLWSWLDWLGSGDFLNEALDQNDDGDFMLVHGAIIRRMSLAAADLALLVRLKNAAASRTLDDFSSTTFTCGICFEDKKGRSCVKMSKCGCVFCRDCLASCWTLAVREGAVSNVACPSVDCTKARVNARNTEMVQGSMPDEASDTCELDLVESVVGSDLRDRYQWLLEKQKVENAMPHCQAPVPPPDDMSIAPPKRTNLKDKSVDADTTPKLESPTKSNQDEARRRRDADQHERYRCCPKCNFSFCRYCQRTWHGVVIPCALPASNALVSRYLALDPEDQRGRAQMEQRYGKKNLERLVREHQENEANKAWFEENTQSCPVCASRVNKSAGCNHMSCSKCQAHFCYRCGKALKATDPYEHYRTPTSGCFEKLFDEAEIARFEREMAGDVQDVDWRAIAGGGGIWD